MTDDENTKASNFTLKMDYPSADVAGTLRRKRFKLADTKLGIKDQLDGNDVRRDQETEPADL